MTRIFRNHFRYSFLMGEDNNLSAFQLRMDAATVSFFDQSTNPFSIATFTAAGMIGKCAKWGISSLFASSGLAHTLPAQLLTHLGSLGAEAALFTGVNYNRNDHSLESAKALSEFFSHFINFATFRMVGHLGCTRNGVLLFASQSSAMVAGHQVASVFGFESHAYESLSQQLLEACLSTLHIQTGSGIVGMLTGRRLYSLERKAEGRSDFNKTRSLVAMSNVGENLWSPRMKDLLERVNDRSFSYEDNADGIFNFEYAESFREGSTIELLHDANGERLVWIETEPNFRRLHYRNSEGSEVKIKSIRTFFSESKIIEEEAITPSPTYLYPHTSFGGLNSTMIELELKTENQRYNVRYFFLGKIPDPICENRVMQRGMFKVPEHPVPPRTEFGELAEFEHVYKPVQPLSEFLDDKVKVFEAQLVYAQSRLREPARRRTALIHGVRFESSNSDREPPLLLLKEAFVEEPDWMRKNCLRLKIIAIETERVGGALHYRLQGERGDVSENFSLRVNPIDTDFFQFRTEDSFYLAPPFHFGYTSLKEGQREVLLLRKISYVEFIERTKRIYKVVDKRLVGLDYHVSLQAFDAHSASPDPKPLKIYFISYDLYNLRLADVVREGNYLEVLNDEPAPRSSDGP